MTALWGVAFSGSRPLAALVNGTLTDLTPAQLAFVVAAVLTVLTFLLAR